MHYAGMHHLRHVWTTFKASMGKFFSSLVDLRQVYFFRHAGRHVEYILGQFFIRIWAKMLNKKMHDVIPLTPTNMVPY